MKHTMTKLVGAAAATALVAPGIALAAEMPTVLAPDDSNASWTRVEASGQHAGEGMVQKASVAGQFACTQDCVSPTAAISGVFMKAANALCQSLAQATVVPTADGAYTVSHDGDAVHVEAGEGDAKTQLMGCACASNVPGGAAVMNAQVSGVSLASLLAQL